MATDCLTAVVASGGLLVVAAAAAIEVQKKRKKRKIWTKQWILRRPTSKGREEGKGEDGRTEGRDGNWRGWDGPQ